MKRHIVLSVNQNEDYAYFVPLTCFLWRKFGWEPILFYIGGRPDYIDLAISEECPVYLDPIPGIRDSTIAQVSRMYGARFADNDDDIVMLGDIDLLPLGNHWHPDGSQVTVYNHDLTGHTEIPMCFVATTANKWKQIMDLTNVFGDINRDLAKYENAKSDDFYKFWGCDQQILTDRLKKYGYENIKFIDRGPSDIHGYARGRVDRAPGGWRFDLPELIDAHLEQQTHHSTAKIERLNELLRHVWPTEDWSWWHKYTEEFRKLTGHTG